MRSAMLLCLLVFQLSYGEHSFCYSNEPAALVKLAELPVKSNRAYQFKIQNQASPVTIIRNSNGTFFHGNFSRLTLVGQRKHYQYYSTGFSFKYPAQHRVANVDKELLELQIVYELEGRESAEWRHRKLAVSVTFLLAEYAPPQTFTLGRQINQGLNNGSVVDLSAMLHLVPNLSMVLYKGTHSEQPSDTGFLWLVRKELLLMSEAEFQQVKSLIYAHRAREGLSYHGLLSRISDLNQISELQVVEKLQL